MPPHQPQPQTVHQVLEEMEAIINDLQLDFERLRLYLEQENPSENTASPPASTLH